MEFDSLDRGAKGKSGRHCPNIGPGYKREPIRIPPDLRLRSTSAREAIELQLEVAGSLELVSLTALPIRLRLPFSLTPLPSSSSSFPGGADWASGSAIRHVFAQPFAGDEHPPGMPAPSRPFLLCETEHPKP